MPRIYTPTECTEIYDILMDIAEVMVAENCGYYSNETDALRNKWWDAYTINLTHFKSRSIIDTRPEVICMMTDEEQLLFVLFAAQMCLTGDTPE